MPKHDGKKNTGTVIAEQRASLHGERLTEKNLAIILRNESHQQTQRSLKSNSGYFEKNSHKQSKSPQVVFAPKRREGYDRQVYGKVINAKNVK